MCVFWLTWSVLRHLVCGQCDPVRNHVSPGADRLVVHHAACRIQHQVLPPTATRVESYRAAAAVFWGVRTAPRTRCSQFVFNSAWAPRNVWSPCSPVRMSSTLCFTMAWREDLRARLGSNVQGSHFSGSSLISGKMWSPVSGKLTFVQRKGYVATSKNPVKESLFGSRLHQIDF